MGRGADFKPSFAHKGFVVFCLRVPSPTSVGFAAHAAVGLRAAKRPCLPKTSLVADATNGFTHGRVPAPIPHERPKQYANPPCFQAGLYSKKNVLVGLLDGENTRVGDMRLITSRQGNRGSAGNAA